MPWMTIEALLDAMDYYNAALVDFANAKRIPIVENGSSIPPDNLHYTDCMHLSDAGCAAMAQRFVQFFERTEVIHTVVKRIRSHQLGFVGTFVPEAID